MKNISSASNDIYKSFTRLYSRKYRDREGLYIIEGTKLVEEAVNNGARLRSVFIREEYTDPDLSHVLNAAENQQAEVYTLTRQLFDGAADTETPQGIAAVAEKPPQTPENFIRPGENILVLDRIQDPGNLGTIIRTADAAGIRSVMIVKGTADMFMPKVVRAAAGSIHRIRFMNVDTPDEAAGFLKVNGKRLVCTSPHADTCYYDIDLSADAAIVIGNEANGTADKFIELADSLITIPMEGVIESLNAGVAAAVVMYESVRQNKIKNT